MKKISIPAECDYCPQCPLVATKRDSLTENMEVGTEHEITINCRQGFNRGGVNTVFMGESGWRIERGKRVTAYNSGEEQEMPAECTAYPGKFDEVIIHRSGQS